MILTSITAQSNTSSPIAKST